MESKNEQSAPLSFYGGKAGALIPVLSMMGMILALLFLGQSSLKNYWAAAFFAICIAFLLCREKGQAFNDTIIGSLVNPMFSSFVLIYLLAGVLSSSMQQSGLIDGLIWLGVLLHVNPALLPAITFLVCVLISTACGTTGGTVSAVTPILFPLAVSLGCPPALILGAIISGSFFGDNLAPISDTTIASAGCMHSSVPAVVRSRLPYSLTGGAVSFLLYLVLGFRMTDASAAAVPADPGGAKTLIMLAIPLLMVVLMLKGVPLISVLLVCDLASLGLETALGFISPIDLVSSDGPVISGLESMVSLILFTAMIMVLQGFMEKSGVMADTIKLLKSRCHSQRSAELAIYLLIHLTVWSCGTNGASILIVGPVARSLCRTFSIDRRRGANLLDGVACGTCGICPYNGSLLTMYSLAGASGMLPGSVGVFSILPFSFHCISLLIIYLAAVLTGWGRKSEVYPGEKAASESAS